MVNIFHFSVGELVFWLHTASFYRKVKQEEEILGKLEVEASKEL